MACVQRHGAGHAAATASAAAEIGDDDDLAQRWAASPRRPATLSRDVDLLAVVPVAVRRDEDASARSGRSGRARPARRNRASRTTRPRRARRPPAWRRSVSGMLGIMAATRSPALTPCARSSCCSRETSSCSSSQDRRRSTLSSPRKTMRVAGAARCAAGSRRSSGARRERSGRPASGRRRPAALALVADDAAEIPDQAPERLAILDRPAVQLGIGRQRCPGPGRGRRHERRQRRFGDPIGRWVQSGAFTTIIMSPMRILFAQGGAREQDAV